MDGVHNLGASRLLKEVKLPDDAVVVPLLLESGITPNLIGGWWQRKRQLGPWSWTDEASQLCLATGIQYFFE